MSVIFNVVKRKLTPDSLFGNAVSSSQEAITFKFNLDEEWSGFTVYAQFGQDGKTYDQYLDGDNCVSLPTDIKVGSCTLMLYGTGNKTISTANYITLRINANNLVPDMIEKTDVVANWVGENNENRGKDNNVVTGKDNIATEESYNEIVSGGGNIDAAHNGITTGKKNYNGRDASSSIVGGYNNFNEQSQALIGGNSNKNFWHTMIEDLAQLGSTDKAANAGLTFAPSVASVIAVTGADFRMNKYFYNIPLTADNPSVQLQTTRDISASGYELTAYLYLASGTASVTMDGVTTSLIADDYTIIAAKKTSDISSGSTLLTLTADETADVRLLGLYIQDPNSNGSATGIVGAWNMNSGASNLMYGETNSNTAGSSLVGGKGNKNDSDNSALMGRGLKNEKTPNSTKVGQFNEDIADALFEVGSGTDGSTRKSPFYVSTDGTTHASKLAVDTVITDVNPGDLMHVGNTILNGTNGGGYSTVSTPGVFSTETKPPISGLNPALGSYLIEDISALNNGDYPTLITASGFSIDVSDTGLIGGWFYFDGTLPADGQIEFTSGGKADNGEVNFSLLPAKNPFQTGWNYVVFDLQHEYGSSNVADGAVGYNGITRGPIDLTQVNYFRMYAKKSVCSFAIFQLACITSDVPAMRYVRFPKPTKSYEIANKQYVDEAIAALRTELQNS